MSNVYVMWKRVGIGIASIVNTICLLMLIHALVTTVSSIGYIILAGLTLFLISYISCKTYSILKKESTFTWTYVYWSECFNAIVFTFLVFQYFTHNFLASTVFATGLPIGIYLMNYMMLLKSRE